jgi:hypothetical protein
MARIIYCHPGRTKYDYHIYTDLDFWDARRVLRSLATVRRNFGDCPPGDEFPTQVVGLDMDSRVSREIEKRLARAITSPPRHVVVRSMMFNGYFEFDPLKYYPKHWPESLIMHFTYARLPLAQSQLSNAYQTIKVTLADGNMRVERVQREKKYDPIIKDIKAARRHALVPSCF